MGKTTDSQTATAEAAAPAAPLPAAAAAPASTAWTDEHQGAGGAYEMVDGRRVLVGRTKAADADAQA